jgi:hypothetical protein
MHRDTWCKLVTCHLSPAANTSPTNNQHIHAYIHTFENYTVTYTHIPCVLHNYHVTHINPPSCQIIQIQTKVCVAIAPVYSYSVDRPFAARSKPKRWRAVRSNMVRFSKPQLRLSRVQLMCCTMLVRCWTVVRCWHSRDLADNYMLPWCIHLLSTCGANFWLN